jgi:hypothetical protein
VEIIVCDLNELKYTLFSTKCVIVYI